MQGVLMVTGIVLTSNLVAYVIYCIKGMDKGNKIEIMSVRSELQKIERISQADKQSFLK